MGEARRSRTRHRGKGGGPPGGRRPWLDTRAVGPPASTEGFPWTLILVINTPKDPKNVAPASRASALACAPLPDPPESPTTPSPPACPMDTPHG